MARSLYRAYLYVVAIGMLVFAAVALYLVLYVLLRQTSLSGTYAAPLTRNEAVQSLIFGALAWIIAGSLGGFHYERIRKDMRRFPDARESAVRSFFLNFCEAIASLVAVIATVNFVTQLAGDVSTGTDVSTLAVALTAVAVTAALELERRRGRPHHGVALTMQRLHEYGAPLILLLFVAAPAWQQAISRTTLTLSAQGDARALCDTYGACPPVYHPVFLWIAAALVSLGIAWYATLVYRDTRSNIRQIAHLASAAYGFIWLVIGVQSGVELALRGMFGVSVQSASIADMTGQLGFGALAALAYGLWLRQEAAALPMGAGALELSEEAMASVTLAVPFYWGAGLALRYLFETNVANGADLTRADLAFALSLLATGVFYIPLALTTRRRTQRLQSTGPRRVMTLSLLAAGVITAAVGVVVALYALGTKLLGSPIALWQQTARTGAVVLVVGAALVGVYRWVADRERAFGPVHLLPAAPVAPVAPVAPAAAPAQPHDEVDEVLDEFAAGQLSHDTAAERLRELTHAGH